MSMITSRNETARGTGCGCCGQSYPQCQAVEIMIDLVNDLEMRGQTESVKRDRQSRSHVRFDLPLYMALTARDHSAPSVRADKTLNHCLCTQNFEEPKMNPLALFQFSTTFSP